MKLRPDINCITAAVLFAAIQMIQGERFGQMEFFAFQSLLCTGFICAAIRQGRQ